MRLFGAITKIEAADDGTIRVEGIASSGAIDDADETVSPDAMKAALPAYMRFGALREMHGMSAAGATLKAEVGEDGVTRIQAHVVDPVAVKKVKMGVYKGFSIGGRVLARDPDDKTVITKLRLNEISLVDRPCNPEAVIDVWKADTETAPITTAPTNAEVIAKAIEMAKVAGKGRRYADFLVKAREALIETAPPLSLEPELGAELNAAASEAGPIFAEAAKVGARNSADDLALIQATHDHMVALGACCGDASGPDDAKAAPADDLLKMVVENDRLTRLIELQEPRMEMLCATIEALQKRIEVVAATPTAPKTFAGHARAVGKAEDVSPAGAGAVLSADELKKYLGRP